MNISPNVPADPNGIIAAALASEHPSLVRLAERACKLVEDMHGRLASVEQDRAKEGARRRLAELEAERAELLATVGRPVSRAPRQPRSPINHGKVGGAQQHRLRGEEPCAWCRHVEVANLAEARARKAAKAAQVAS